MLEQRCRKGLISLGKFRQTALRDSGFEMRDAGRRGISKMRARLQFCRESNFRARWSVKLTTLHWAGLNAPSPGILCRGAQVDAEKL